MLYEETDSDSSLDPIFETLTKTRDYWLKEFQETLPAGYHATAYTGSCATGLSKKIPGINITHDVEKEPVMTKKVVSPFSKKTRYVVGLGKLTEEGDYNVRLGKEKCDLHVSNRPYGGIATSSLRLFYLIRSGVVIDCAGKYNRPVGHTDTNVLVHPSAASKMRPAGTVISSPLGWYDAGDYNKYVVNSAFSIGLMFAAYEQLTDYV